MDFSQSPNPGKFKIKFKKLMQVCQLAFIALLFILTYNNDNYKYVSENPKFFITNCLVVGISGAVASAFICWNRSHKKIIKNAFIAFLFFFMLQVVREFSGSYSFDEETSTPQTPGHQRGKTMYNLAKLFVILIGLVFIYYAFKIRESVPYNLKIGGNYSFIIETLIFAVIMAIAEIVVGLTHYQSGETIFKKVLIYTLVFYIITSVVLQYGGYHTKD